MACVYINRIGNVNISVWTNSKIIEKAFNAFISQGTAKPGGLLHEKKAHKNNRHVKISLYLKNERAIKISSQAILTGFSNLRMLSAPGMTETDFNPAYYQYRGIQYAVFPGFAVIKINLNQKQADIVFSGTFAVDALLEIAFNHSLFNLVEGRGRFVLHASGIAKNGRAVLFPGAAGKGKTTLAIALALSGFKWIGDDIVMLSANKETGFSVFPVFDTFRINLDSNSLALLSFAKKDEHIQLKPFDKKAYAYKKHPFLLNAACLQARSRLMALVFPEITHESASYIRRLKSRQSAERLLYCQYPHDFYHVNSGRKTKLGNIFDLASNMESYQFFLGKDIESWNGIIRSLFRKGCA